MEKSMKRFLIFLVAFTLFTSCGSDKNPANNGDGKPAPKPAFDSGFSSDVKSRTSALTAGSVMDEAQIFDELQSDISLYRRLAIGMQWQSKSQSPTFYSSGGSDFNVCIEVEDTVKTIVEISGGEVKTLVRGSKQYVNGVCPKDIGTSEAIEYILIEDDEYSNLTPSDMIDDLTGVTILKTSLGTDEVYVVDHTEGQSTSKMIVKRGSPAIVNEGLSYTRYFSEESNAFYVYANEDKNLVFGIDTTTLGWEAVSDTIRRTYRD